MVLVQTARFLAEDGAHWVTVEGEQAVVLSAAPWDGGTKTDGAFRPQARRAACPVAPRKIFGIGKNYRAHASEMGGAVPTEPLVFAKTTTSLVGPDGTVLLPPESARVDYEGELGVVIGRRARRVPASQAMEHVFGYVPVCDVTARDFQVKDGQWTRAKGFDTFCPVGPMVVSGVDPAALTVVLTVDGAVKQRGETKDMVFDVAALVAHLSNFATLEPGDSIATGTPEGVGPLAPGNRVEVSIEPLGTLRFDVAREA